MIEMASQITSLAIVYSIVYSDADQRKHQSSASLVFVRGINRGPVNSPHKWPVTRKMFPFDDVIMRHFTGVWGVFCEFTNLINALRPVCWYMWHHIRLSCMIMWPGHIYVNNTGGLNASFNVLNFYVCILVEQWSASIVPIDLLKP